MDWRNRFALELALIAYVAMLFLACYMAMQQLQDL